MSRDFNPKEWLTTSEASEMTGYDPAHIRWLVREGRVRGQKFGRDWMIRRENLLTYKAKMDDLGATKHDPWRSGARQRKNSSS